MRYLDINGNPVKRNPRDYPYTYDPFVIYKGDDFSRDGNESFYSDRLSLWYDANEIKDLRNKYSIDHGDYFWAYNSVNMLNMFLTDLMKRHVRITAIIEHCNVSNGYPIWLVYFKEVKNSGENS